MNPVAITIKILQDNTFCILGTASGDGQPWITPVAYTVDNQANFYWTSERDTKHSNLLTVNPHMTICIFDQEHTSDVQYPNGNSHPRALYFTGQGREVPYAELTDLLHWRYPKGNHQTTEFDPEITKQAIYQFTTEMAYYLADPAATNGAFGSQRATLEVDALRASLANTI